MFVSPLSPGGVTTTITSTEFRGNVVTSEQAPLLLLVNVQAAMSATSFSGNTAAAALQLGVAAGSSLAARISMQGTVKPFGVLHGLAFRNNSGAGLRVDALHDDASELEIANAVFEGNRPSTAFPGALSVGPGAATTLTLTNSTFTGNRAAEGKVVFGGALHLAVPIGSVLARAA